MSDTELHDDVSRHVGTRVREELARRRVSRQALADMARISLSTLEKALAGTRPFTLASTLRIEEALGVALRPGLASEGADTAPDGLGGYSRGAVRWVEGDYLTIRPSFATPGDLFTYVTEIRWDVAAGHLLFGEHRRTDGQFAQKGVVSLPNLSGHLYLVTNDQGQYRMIVLGRPASGGALHGLLTTLQVGQGSQLVPASCPIVLVPLARYPDAPIGQVAPQMADFAALRHLLDDTCRRDFARFHG